MTEDKKKEKVLHTRITEDLEKQIKEEAGSLGVSVSNLVRNILANTTDLVGNIVTDSASVARSAYRRSTPSYGSRSKEAADPAAASVPARILGWQEVILNLNAVCDQCNEILKKGSRAAIAVVESYGPRPTICLNCLKEVTHEDQNGTTDDESIS